MHNPAHLLSACHPVNATWTAASHTHTYIHTDQYLCHLIQWCQFHHLHWKYKHRHKHPSPVCTVDGTAICWRVKQVSVSPGGVINLKPWACWPHARAHARTHTGSGWPATTLPSLPEARLSCPSPVGSAVTLSNLSSLQPVFTHSTPLPLYGPLTRRTTTDVDLNRSYCNL